MDISTRVIPKPEMTPLQMIDYGSFESPAEIRVTLAHSSCVAACKYATHVTGRSSVLLKGRSSGSTAGILPFNFQVATQVTTREL